MSPTSIRGCEVPFDQIRTPRQGSAAGTVVVGLGAGCDTPSRPSRLHEPAHRPLGLIATPPAFQDFATPSTAAGFVRSSCEEDTSQKLASSSTALCGFSDKPLFRQGVATLNATPPDSGTSHRFRGGCLPRRRSVRVSCSSLGFPPRRKGRRFVSEIDPPSGPHAARP